MVSRHRAHDIAAHAAGDAGTLRAIRRTAFHPNGEQRPGLLERPPHVTSAIKDAGHTMSAVRHEWVANDPGAKAP